MNLFMKFVCLIGFMLLIFQNSFSQNLSITLYVATGEGNIGKGTESSPFPSLLQAQDYIREIKKTKGLPEGGIKVVIKEGEYKIKDTLIFTNEDSGTSQSPIIYSAVEDTYTVFSGGIRLGEFKKVENEPGSERLRADVKDKVYVIDLKKYGINNLPPV